MNKQGLGDSPAFCASKLLCIFKEQVKGQHFSNLHHSKSAVSSLNQLRKATEELHCNFTVASMRLELGLSSLSPISSTVMRMIILTCFQLCGVIH